MRKLFGALPPLTDAERELWLLDQAINARGFHVDRNLAHAMQEVAVKRRAEIAEALAQLSGGEVSSPDETDRIKAWLGKRGHKLNSIDKKAKAKLLSQSLAPDVEQVLELVAEGARKTVNKANGLLASIDDDERLRGSLIYYGATSGRWSASGFQPQNISREDENFDAAKAISAFLKRDTAAIKALGKPLEVAGLIARGLICAPPGRLPLAGDYSQIEARILAWYANETHVLDDFRRYDETKDPQLEIYCRTASAILKRVVTPANKADRQIGKAATLALGYGGGLRAWRLRDDKTPDDEVRQYIKAWKKSRPATVKFWQELDDTLRRAIGEPGMTFSFGRLIVGCEDGVLQIVLPSGRILRFPSADVVDGNFEDSWNIQFKKWEKRQWRDTTEFFGKFVATVVSGTARDLMAHAMLQVAAAGYDIVLTVHDELVAEIDDGGSRVDREHELVRLMTQAPPWADGLPIVADVRCGKRYIKSDTPCQDDNVRAQEPCQDVNTGAAPPGNGDYGKPYKATRSRLLKDGFRLVESFAYEVPGGKEPLYWEDRYERGGAAGAKAEKQCRFRHRVNGADLSGTGPRRVAWNWPVIMAAGPGSTVYITEGARKSHALGKVGLLASAVAYHQWGPECVCALAGMHLIYLEDHDLPAKKYSADAQNKLAPAAASFRIVPGSVLWKDLGRAGDPPPGFDVFDWLGLGGKAARLAGMADQQGVKDSFEVSSAADLQNEVFPAIKFVVPGYVAEGVTLFAGKPKIGKSWLVLHACWAVATGGVTLGNIQVEQGDVIYAALEDNKRRMKGRMERLFGKTPWPRALEIVYRMKKLKEGGVAQLRGWIEAKKNPKLVVIDTLKMVRTPAAKGQSYYEADYDAVVELRELAAEFGIAIIVIHHQRKAEADDLFDTVSGTLGLTGAVDSIMIIDRTGSGTILAARGRDIEEINQAVEFDNCAWRIIGNADFVRVSGERRQVLEVMEEAKDEPLSAHQIAQAIGGKANSVTSLLRKMVKEGMVTKRGYGKYVLNTGL
jgi:hypothetical protein